jgi:hypothetical protein
MKDKISDRQLTFILLMAIVPLGLLSKSYKGFGSYWVNNYAGDVLYEVFWCLFIFLLFPKKTQITKIVLGVLFVTCILEFLQLWHPLWLETFRAYFLGRILIGTTFSWWDFPHYVAGSAIGWLCLDKINRRSY